MFMIMVGDGDIDYTDVFGPYDTADAAEQAIIDVFGNDDPDSDLVARTTELRPTESLIDYLR